ncbi:MAG: amino acid aminotransferase [Chloroflexi bacterium]|nr:amino acid aminotransferase [Chloroflexota bacterium]
MDSDMSVLYINGEFVDADSASVPARDLAILRGFGVFDYLRTYGGVPFQLGAHLRRLQRSAALIELACPWDLETLGEIVLETLRRNSFVEAGIRLVVTGGDSPNSFMPGGDSRLLVMATALQYMPAAVYQRGAGVATVEQHRHLPEAKTINYIPGIMAQRRAPDAIDAIYCVDGLVVEGTRSNIFIFKDDRWITPDAGLLPGITRAEVIKLLGRDGRLELRAITLDEFYSSDEIILTSTTKEIVPIVQVDDVTIGAGAPGENSRRLMRQWREMTDAYALAGRV